MKLLPLIKGSSHFPTGQAANAAEFGPWTVKAPSSRMCRGHRRPSRISTRPFLSEAASQIWNSSGTGRDGEWGPLSAAAGGGHMQGGENASPSADDVPHNGVTVLSILGGRGTESNLSSLLWILDRMRLWPFDWGFQSPLAVTIS